MQIIKNKGEVWAVKDGFIIAEGEKELNIEEQTQKAYLLDTLGAFTAENAKILDSLLNNNSTRSYSDGDVISDGHKVYLPNDMEVTSRWRQRLKNSNVSIMDIIEKVEDIEELKTLLRAVANMPGYNLLKVGFIEQIAEAIISQTKKQVKNAAQG